MEQLRKENQVRVQHSEEQVEVRSSSNGSIHLSMILKLTAGSAV